MKQYKYCQILEVVKLCQMLEVVRLSVSSHEIVIFVLKQHLLLSIPSDYDLKMFSRVFTY